jgi:hypothetical protein
MTGLRSTVGKAVGRLVDAVLVVERTARTELYFHFDDDTYFEIYGNFQCSSRLRSASLPLLRSDFHAGDAVVEYWDGADEGTPRSQIEYQEFVLGEIEGYKNSLRKEELLALGTEAAEEIQAATEGICFLTEVLMQGAVDRIILRRLRLPSFTTWCFTTK